MRFDLATVAEVLSILGATLDLLALFVMTMIPLRMIAVGGHLSFLVSGTLSGALPDIIAYGITFPVNIWRLIQMKRLATNVRRAADGDLSVDWLSPFMQRMDYPAGTILFRKGQQADELFYITSGSVLLLEIDEHLGPGHLLGEIGFFTPDGTRSLTAICETNCTLHRISQHEFRALYFQNPDFGFYIIRLIAQRLTADVDRLEAQLAIDRAPLNP